ncbi:MAG: PAS domain S-box protein, partial [Lacipirellulaceae bacterium]
LNSTNVHTIFLDAELCIRRFTPGIRETFNLIAQDIGRRFDSFTYNIDYEELPTDVKRVLADRTPCEREVQDRSGSWFLLRVLPYLSQGKTDGAVITLVDITSLKQAEATLAELSEIVEHSQDAVFRCDLDGTIRTWNRGAENLFGYSAKEIIGQHVKLLNLTESDRDLDVTLSQIAEGRTIDRLQSTPQRRDDTNFHVALTWSPISDENDRVVGASAIARDMTSEKRAEAEVREAIKRRDQFMAMLSHELRNPLAAVLNATTLLNENQLDEETDAEARNVIEHNVRHVARMLDDLLDVARITNDKINLHKEVVDLNSLLVDAVECVQHRIDEKQQELHLSSPETPIYVEGDVGRLQQSQVNLLVNASKYTPEGGKIHYSLGQQDGFAVLRVKDNGDGIPPDLIDRIFEPFLQSDETLDRSQGGMGLGLTVVQKVMEGHGGIVEALSDGTSQ